MSYTDKERYESAEEALMKAGESTCHNVLYAAKQHFAKFDPPLDPDKELKERFKELFFWMLDEGNDPTNEEIYQESVKRNLLATQARLNEVRRGVLDEFKRSVHLAGYHIDQWKKLRTKFEVKS